MKSFAKSHPVNKTEATMVVTFRGFIDAIIKDPEFKKKLKNSVGKRKKKPTAEEKELERFYRFIGEYIALFQEIESKLDQILLLAIGHDRWHVGQTLISPLSVTEKINAVRGLVLSSSIVDDKKRDRWVSTFKSTFGRLEIENSRRNRIVHSTYLYQFMEGGHPPLRAKRRRTKNELSFEYENVDEKNRATAVAGIAELAFDVGYIHTQLVHWGGLLWKQRKM